MERVLKDAAGGYYRASIDESVIDVMEGITGDVNADVALVFEGKELRGLFTDSDYIKVCILLDMLIGCRLIAVLSLYCSDLLCFH